MKKKGLIISTVVMVVVLIASLTTATYAWFKADAKTSITGFNIEVTSGNVLNIGLKGDAFPGDYKTASVDSFVSGTCAYVAGADGAFGHWTGDTSLAAIIADTGVLWGTQSKAVGFSTADSKAEATFANTKFFHTADGTTVNADYDLPVKANGTLTSMATADDAAANKVGESAGDYVYLYIGAQATKAMQDNTNKFYIVIQPQGAGTTIGIASAIHVAYRVSKASGDFTEWTDVDVFGNKHYTDARTGVSAEDIPGNWTTDTKLTTSSATWTEATNTTTISGAIALPITLSNWNGEGVAPLDQIEIVVYLAGADSDCVDAAKNGLSYVALYFTAQEVVVAGA